MASAGVPTALPLLIAAGLGAALCGSALLSSRCAAARACAAGQRVGAAGGHRARLRQLAARVGAVRASACLLSATALGDPARTESEGAAPGWPRASALSAPVLLVVTFYTFVGVYFVHVTRIISGAGDDAQMMSTRVHALFANGLAYGGYAVIFAVALSFHRGPSLWRWHACFLSALLLAGGFVLLFVGARLRQLLQGLPTLSSARKAAMVSRTTTCTAIAGTALLLRAAYGLLLASSLLGNDGPYPVRSAMEKNATRGELFQYAWDVNVAESLDVVVLEMLPIALLLFFTRKMGGRNTHRSDADLGLEELMSPLRGEAFLAQNGRRR